MIKVFIIDDSALVRKSIARMLESETEIMVIGESSNPIDALNIFKIVGLPDVFILDIEMPKMNGLAFLKKLSEQKPTPVIICSSLASNGSNEAIDAMRLGAVEVIQKPIIGVKEFFSEQREELVGAIKSASHAKVVFRDIDVEERGVVADIKRQYSPSTSFVAIGSSTGGVQVIEEIVSCLKPNHQGIVITQHMPKGFTASFAARLDKIFASKVVEASNGEIITSNKIIMAKGGIHLEVVKEGGLYKTILKDFPKVNSHKPSVNVLFGSIAKLCNGNVTAFILTGMGDDGAAGMDKLKKCGVATYGQNKDSCAVYGMPSAAKQMGAVDKELSVAEIIDVINGLV